MFNKTMIAIAFSSLTLTACSKSSQSTPSNESTSSEPTSAVVASQVIETPTSAVTSVSEVATPSDNAQTSLDWNGQYTGTLPCADCEGIKTELTLHADQSYEMSETYLGKGDGKAFMSKGKFSFDKAGTIITLDPAGDQRKYFVAENALNALNTEGKKITGPGAELYVLAKKAQ
ncbi:putative lipoprotein NlpE involved in copper resistance [Acinetobacter calcoaceticus]|uniref:Putative lipoprotein NlpE involved in copper resistance n=1 Tax=Acinetobacter calcoaceticus TaxID=471 RepID=A0A4R1Y175_ACICA|nr:putative lipoprotein NlpE involved in copper resistance [Acinetobacter calcoaceticus]